MVRNASRRLVEAAQGVASSAETIAGAGKIVGDALAAGKKILICGNGGSAACAQHFAAEFTGKLALDRRPFPAISLTVDTSSMTAIANDYSYDEVFSRQVTALGAAGDVLVALSTSGRSINIGLAIEAAHQSGLTTIALTGPINGIGGDLQIPACVRETARIQETHDLVLHSIAQIAERCAVPTLRDDASADRFEFVLEPDQLESFRGWIEESGQILVTTNGVFDLLHAGHRDSLARAREFGDRLVVLLNSDDAVRRLKGPTRPVQRLETRLSALASVADIGHVAVFEDDPAEMLGRLRPHVHCKGEDYIGKVILERAVVEDHGGRVELLPITEGVSTSSIIAGFSDV